MSFIKCLVFKDKIYREFEVGVKYKISKEDDEYYYHNEIPISKKDERKDYDIIVREIINEGVF